jgi:hypothetical protein
LTSLTRLQRREEQGRLTLDFKKDLLASFSKHKVDVIFVDMRWARAPGAARFSPFELVKIRRAEAGDCYFTMSANGVLHVTHDRTAEHFGLDEWAREQAVFKHLKKLMIFRRFPLWKMVRFSCCSSATARALRLFWRFRGIPVEFARRSTR